MLKKIIAHYNRLSILLKNTNFQTFIVLMLSIFLFLLASPSWAQEEDSTSDSSDDVAQLDTYKTWEDVTNVHLAAQDTEIPNSELQAANATTSSLMAALTEINPANLDTYASIVENPDIPTMSKIGLLGASDLAVDTTLKTQPNISVTEHLAYQWVPGYKDSMSTYAASYTGGYQFLQQTGIQSLWSDMLIIAYILFVVVLIVAGFMIMFRSKIGGQTAVTIYNTLPNVVVGLVLVTFSFAIVGFILNISVVLTQLVGNFLFKSAWNPSNSNILRVTNPFSLSGNSFKQLGTKVIGFALTKANPIGVMVSAPFRIGKLLKIFTPPNQTTNNLLASGFWPLITTLFLSIVYIYASIKVFITLLKAFLGILIDTIFAPLILTISAIPGQNAMRKNWFNRLMRNSMTFPVVFFLINLPAYFTINGINLSFQPLSQGTWNPSGALINNAIQKVGIAVMEGLIPLVLYFTAANAPKFLLEIFPTKKSEGLQATQQGVKADLSKVPFLKRFAGAGGK